MLSLPIRSCNLSLYLVANRPSYPDEKQFILKIREAVSGGVTCVQLRDHISPMRDSIRIAHKVKEQLQGVPFFINTPHAYEVARAVEANGVFFESITFWKEAREKLVSMAGVGVAVRTIEDVLFFLDVDIDYLSVKIAASKKTCPRNDYLWGIEGLEMVRKIAPHRIVAVGGLDVDSVEPIYKKLLSTDGVAMAGGLMDQVDPRGTAQKIREIAAKIRGIPC